MGLFQKLLDRHSSQILVQMESVSVQPECQSPCIGNSDAGLFYVYCVDKKVARFSLASCPILSVSAQLVHLAPLSSPLERRRAYFVTTEKLDILCKAKAPVLVQISASSSLKVRQ